MNKRTKTLALLLAAATMLTACGQPAGTQPGESNKDSESSQIQESESKSTETAGVFNAEGFPIVNEDITIRILTQTNVQTTAFTDMNEAPAWKYIEELTGINIEIEEYSAEDLGTKLPLIMADPDNMPDIIWQGTLGEDDTMSYGEQGLLLDMSDYLEEYGPNILETFASDSIYEGWARSADGGLYSLPSYNGKPSGVAWMINTRWMENCGITEVPTTLEEFKEMLIKFRDMDANGNGDPNDEIPLQGNNNSIWSLLYDSVGMLGSWPYIGALWSSDDDSTESYPIFMDERYRYCVEFVHSLYEENLINQDYLTTEESNARRLNDIHGVLCSQTWPTKEEKYDPDEWVAVAPFKSEYYDMEYWAAGPAYQTNMAAITANTKYPEVCVRLLDYMMSLEGSLLQCSGQYGKYDADVLAANGVSQEALDLVREFYETNNDSGVVNANFFGTYGCRDLNKLEQCKLPTTTYANNIEKTLAEDIKEPYADKMKIAYTYSLKFMPEESDVIAQYQADVDTYVKDKISQWVTGGEELNDDTWNAYIEQLQAMNVDELTAAYQSAANRWYGVE